ncbi:MAG: YgjV family protein [Clostridia bacterium]|nr:YgjV family protein [Clostridia bacterium]MBR5278876.1 YgjV family protein [Clostridia bacterium]
MTTYEIIAQSIGIVAMTINIFSFQQKEQRKLIIMQFFGASLFAVNMFMIGAAVGGFLNLIGAFRAIVYANKQKFHTESKLWFIGFCATYLLSYILTFTVFPKEPTALNLTVEFLPIVGMVASHIGFISPSAKTVRKLGLISSPSWMIYNIVNMAIGGIICEIFCFISIIIGIIRLDIRKEQK